MQQDELKVGQRVKVVSVNRTDELFGLAVGMVGEVVRTVGRFSINGAGVEIEGKPSADGKGWWMLASQLELISEEAAPVNPFRVGARGKRRNGDDYEITRHDQNDPETPFMAPIGEGEYWHNADGQSCTGSNEFDLLPPTSYADDPQKAPAAEPRAFKVGDTVRNVGHSSAAAAVGHVGVITDIDSDGDIWIDHKACRKPRYLELVQAVDDTPTTTLSVPPSPLDVYRAAHAKAEAAKAAMETARTAWEDSRKAAREAIDELDAARATFLEAAVA